jgi:hypothetical protein
MGGTWYSYYYVDASNTYIASNGGNIQLQPGGSTKMYLASGGTVGIGTTSPAAKLDITKNDSATSLLIRNGDVNNGGNNEAQIQFGFNGTDDFSHFIRTRHNSADSGGNAIDFYTCDSTENNSITSGVRHNLTLESGNVGIGTTSPATKLHILDNFDPNDNLGYVLVENTNTTSGGPQTNSAVNVRNYHGTSQFMQWENHGLRIGSRRLTNSGTGDIIFTAGADEEKMRLLAGGGLTFNGDTAAANALDDYEEGTWTPILSWNSGGDYTMDNGTTVGRYTKIGNLVYATCTIKWTAAPSSTSGNLVVRGLPFTIATIRNAGCFSASLGGIYFSSSTYTQWTITGDPGRDDMYIIQQGSGVYSHRPTVSSTGTVYSISLTYRV